MPVYRLTIAYDGTSYYGWQRQPDRPTIAGTLESRFYAVFKKEIKLIGASRTDAGVHALGQAASFALDVSIDSKKLLFAWNNALPQDILIRSLSDTSDDFHPQRHVAEKTYYYHFFQQRALPFLGRYGFYAGTIDTEKLRAGLEIFKGTHDFRSFCTGYEAESTIRTITEVEVVTFKRYGVQRIVVKGPGFLRYMIRRIVGACLDVAAHKEKSIIHLQDALAECNPHQHLHVAPAQGLVLHSIEYEHSIQSERYR